MYGILKVNNIFVQINKIVMKQINKFILYLMKKHINVIQKMDNYVKKTNYFIKKKINVQKNVQKNNIQFGHKHSYYVLINVLKINNILMKIIIVYKLVKNIQQNNTVYKHVKMIMQYQNMEIYVVKYANFIFKIKLDIVHHNVLIIMNIQ